MANTSTNRHNHSAVVHGSTARLVGLMAAAALMLLLVLSAGITKAGAIDIVFYPPCTTLECQPDVVTPDGQPPVAGETVQIVFHGYKPGSTVTVKFYVDTNADGIIEEIRLTGVADEFGDVEFDWNIPAGVAGDIVYEVSGIDDVTGEVRRESGSVFVEADDLVPDTVPGGGGGPLPYTGSNSTNLVRIGLVLIVAGGISVVAVRRRNAHVDA